MEGSVGEETRSEKRLKGEGGEAVPITGGAASEPPAPPEGAGDDERAYPIIVAEHPPSQESKWQRKDLQVNDVLQEIYGSETVVDGQGEKHKFKDGVDPFEGKMLYDLVNDNEMKLTLEVGCAMGTSALYITQALAENGKGGKHIAIDPNQSTQYKSIGSTSVERAGLSGQFELMEEPSYLALPKLLERQRRGELGKFDLIFIDGWHTFDYTLVDFFYADLLLAKHGILLLDDIRHPGVARVLSYVKRNYRHYDYVRRTPCDHTMATFVKLGEDNRAWNFHKDF